MGKECAVVGCVRQVVRGDLCEAHRSRLRIHGDVMADVPIVDQGATRKWLLDHVGWSDDECLRWPFCFNDSGYGQCRIIIDGRIERRANIAMATLAHGPRPSDTHQAAHSCGHEWCANPKHLRWATPIENAADKHLHGTDNALERNPMRKLTKTDALRIRALHSAGGHSQRRLAREYGVDQSTIWNVVHGKTWVPRENGDRTR